MTKHRSGLLRAWLATWHFINSARKVALNLIFLFILYLFWVALVSVDEPVRAKSGTTLVLRPHGNVVEQYSSSPSDRALRQALGDERDETRLRDLVEAINLAADDSDILQMVIDPGWVWGVGLASLKELEPAVQKFRAAGKTVIALADNLSQHQYYLAAMADEVWLNPHGMVWIDGYSNYRSFYREGLEKLEVEINLFRVGEYKSAMEPYIRDDMSSEAKEAALFWIGSMWHQYLEDVSRMRGIPLEALSDSINTFTDRVQKLEGDFAQVALEMGLVDRLVSRPEARQELARMGKPDDRGESFRQISFDRYLETHRFGRRQKSGAKVAVVVAEGDIVGGRQSAGSIGGESTAADLRRAVRDDDVRAIVFRVNSPGGESFASEQIRRELLAIRDSGKTVVVSMGDVAASGGYWISMAADEIWASPATITGSIGVYGMVPTFDRTLDKIGVHADGVGTTPLAGKLRLDRPLDENLKRVFQSSAERVYEDFITIVAEARGLDESDVRESARGRVWSGEQAASLGLIDRTGTLQEAIDSAARIAGLGSDYQVSWSEPELTGFEALLLEWTTEAVARLGPVKIAAYPRPPDFVEAMLDDLRFLVARNDGLTLAAHCLCGIR